VTIDQESEIGSSQQIVELGVPANSRLTGARPDLGQIVLTHAMAKQQTPQRGLELALAGKPLQKLTAASAELGLRVCVG
jgi:hypothetical protein